MGTIDPLLTVTTGSFVACEFPVNRSAVVVILCGGDKRTQTADIKRAIRTPRTRGEQHVA
jgi:putative component of toxin-antitoxin plasmid stabilization module